MRLLAVFLLSCMAGVSASSDMVWMDLVSAQIIEAEATAVSDAKNIPELAGDLGLSTLVKLVTKANLVDALEGEGPFTLFGPTNDAFGKLPKKFVDILVNNITMLTDVLKYHVLSGEAFSKDLTNDELVPSLQGKDVRINIYKKNDGTVITASGRRVSKPDQAASNGVIHVVDGVLFPPPGTLTDVVVRCPAFSTLLKAVKIAGLADTLAGNGPFTLFAPSNAAFKKIPAKCLDALLKDKKTLTKVLTYHVVPSTQYSAGLSCGEKVKTVEGSDIKITFFKDSVYVNWSKVTFADVTVSNGVMHSIDKVLWPREEAENFCAAVLDSSNNEETDLLKSLYSL